MQTWWILVQINTLSWKYILHVFFNITIKQNKRLKHEVFDNMNQKKQHFDFYVEGIKYSRINSDVILKI